MKIIAIVILCLFVLGGIGQSFAQVSSPGFTTAMDLSHVSSDSELPHVVVSGGGIFAIWVETHSGKSDIFFSKSADGGNTFANPIDLSESVQSQSNYPQLVEDGNNIFVVWQSSISGSSAILVAKSLDGGASFDKPIFLSGQSKLSAFPQMASSDRHVYVSWIEKSEDNSTNIVFAKSDDNGGSFGTPLYVTHGSGNSGIPKISADSNHVYLTWEDDSQGNYEVFLSKSDDKGDSFQAPVDISANTGQSGTPEIVVSQNTVYAVWMDNTPGNYDILFTKSTDGGKTFSKPVNISDDKKDSGYPQIAVWKNSVYLAWTQTMTGANYDVFFARSGNNGDTFDAPINLSNNFGSSGWPKIASDGNVYVSWVDSSPGKFDIFITKSTDGGATFENPTNLSNTNSESYENDMAALNNTVYMVWQEGQRGNHTVVFSKSTTFVPEFGPLASVALLVALISIIIVSLRSSLRLHT